VILGFFGPALSVASTHAGAFAPGQTGIYTVVVTNSGPDTSGMVTVTDTPPGGWAVTSMMGPGWQCNGNMCTRSDVLNPGASYPPITVTVTVSPSASAILVNSVSVAGGGLPPASATDSTEILFPFASSAFFTYQTSLGSGIYYVGLPDGSLFGYYSYLGGGWIFHFDLGYEYVSPGNGTDLYLFDLSSGHWWYTNGSLFPYLYDFSLNAWLYYFPNSKDPGHYTTNPRYFANMTTGQISTM
jgi:uncharacterized repeat protein (TIGR01451 family)